MSYLLDLMSDYGLRRLDHPDPACSGAIAENRPVEVNPAIQMCAESELLIQHCQHVGTLNAHHIAVLVRHKHTRFAVRLSSTEPLARVRMVTSYGASGMLDLPTTVEQDPVRRIRLDTVIARCDHGTGIRFPLA
ncbi:hypothetical protein FSO04_42705 [Paraburkholderia madseniana]|uniref:Uncharacterized protein n=1 Tax=Paraburkholderia madseniana TaxID=2599607 RepID=A0A6N6VZG5_9BURK|nr:hypothetical protein [Paraburkholderia madseniana]KAE8753887.1 hypothetical protein FSO04_42705 [Paraburkholderia madseniana]